MEFIESNCTDPRWNLALEEYVFNFLDPSRSYLMLWQNQNTIVVGKFQNTAGEVNNDYVRQQGITVVRRLSGGGAVYHDLGNLNFTFIKDADPSGQIDLRSFCLPILETLRFFGVPAELSGRNDMIIEGRKFSGNAQYLKNGRVMHHGTLLFDSDLSIMSKALHVDRSKMESKGIQSVESRVTNLKEYLPPDVTMDVFKQQLIRQLSQTTPLNRIQLTEQDKAAITQLCRERYDTWEWNYGRSPAYQTSRKLRIEGCGTVEACLSVESGLISQLRFQGDFFGTEDPSVLANALMGCPCHRDAVTARLLDLDPGRYIKGITTDALLQLIVP